MNLGRREGYCTKTGLFVPWHSLGRMDLGQLFANMIVIEHARFSISQELSQPKTRYVWIDLHHLVTEDDHGIRAYVRGDRLRVGPHEIHDTLESAIMDVALISNGSFQPLNLGEET